MTNATVHLANSQITPSARTIAALPSMGCRWGFGTLLIFAAVLKGFLWISHPLASTGWPQTAAWRIFIVEAEFLLGVWLITGLFAETSRRVAIVAFALLALVSLSKAFSGEASCGCFGNFLVSPWITLCLDAVAVALFATVRPGLARPRGRWRCGWPILVLAPVVGVIAVAGGSQMANSSPGAAPGDPGLVANQPFHDFGEIPTRQAASLEHDFQVKNTTARPVRIIKTTTTCGCTVAEFGGDSIPAGGTTTVTAVAHWAARPGRHLEEIRLYTDAPGTAPFLTLSVGGEVKSFLHVSPALIDFGTVRVGRTPSQELYISNESETGDSIRIVEFASDNPAVSVARVGDGPTRIAPGKPAITVEHFNVAVATKSAALGPLAARLTFRTTGGDRRAISVPVRAQVTPVITVIPASLVFRAGSPASGFPPQQLTLLGEPGVRPAISVLGNEFVADDPQPTADGGRTVRIRYVGSETKGVHRGQLVVSVPNEPSVQVPMMAIRF